MKKNSKDNNRLPSNRTPAPKGQDKGADDRDVGAGEKDQKTSQEIGSVLEVYFKPPLAIARVGGSDTPLESFIWAEDPTIDGNRRTTLSPAVTLEVGPDGTVRPYFPGAIHFKDGEYLRPVAPFFELWVRFQEKGKSAIKDQRLTLAILKELEIPLESVVYRITVANRKAQRRTRRAADAFIARVEAAGNDHARKPLLAVSPHNPQEEPLVFADKPVPLGHFQVIRPTVGQALAVDLSVLRVRFTPAYGEVYGPPTAVTAPASPLKQGDALDPSTLGGRIWEIVPAENRILNPKSRWCRYAMDRQDQMDPTPSDSYDGANVGQNRSWGVVDDTCDGIIEATIVVAGERFVARSRVLSSCPDFAPDRRPFLSFADDLADRDCDPLREVDEKTIEQTEAEVADLFARVSEFASLVNLDATRDNTILANADAKEVRGLPRVHEHTMTSKKEEFYAKGQRYADENVPYKDGTEPRKNGLPYADLARKKHFELANVETLIDTMRAKPDRFRHLLRPPYGRFRQLKRRPGATPDPKFRDPRVARDTVHDMRMPPYMRDSDATALSLTWRQYHEIMAFVKRLNSRITLQPKLGGAERLESPLARRVVNLLDRLQQPKKTDQSAKAVEPQGQSPKIFPRNLTARAGYWVRGNPVVTRPEDTVANCFPGLELDERNLDRRFFPGLVFEFVMWDDDDRKVGARLAYVDHYEDPDLRADDEAAKEGPSQRERQEELFNAIDEANVYGDLSKKGARWFLDAIEQGRNIVKLTKNGEPLGGDVVWRLVRSLEAKEVTVHLRRRDRVRGGKRTYKFTGWRRRFTDEQTGVISAAYKPGELLQSLCSPWQHDFRDCACHYWASNRPDLVYAESPLGETLPGGLSRDPVRATERVDWMRADCSPQRAVGALATMDENRPFQLDHFQINAVWQSLNVVLGDTETGPLWVPPTPDNANPFDSPKDLADNLRKLAKLEMALAFEYLYALLSLRDPENGIPDSISGRWPTLKEDLTVVRHYLLSTATSEMQHLRWANVILWRMRQEGLIDGFEPVLVPALQISCIKDGKPDKRERELRPLTDKALQDFIAVEHPSGSVHGAYGQVVATLRRPEYPQDLVGLAQQIASDGMEHESRFTLIRKLLGVYPKEDAPYLRKVELGTWKDNEDMEKAHSLFTGILQDLDNAYSAADRGRLPESGKDVSNARSKMQDLLNEAEELAAAGVGLPFFEDFS